MVCVGGGVCHLVREDLFIGAFEEAMRWCAWALTEPGYCVLVHGRLPMVQRILRCSKCG